MAGEASFQRKVMKDLKTVPKSWWVKVVTASENGTPDIIGCVRGKFVALELKDQHGKASQLQKLQISRIEGAKGFAAVVHPQEWDSVLAYLKEITNKRRYS